MGVRDLYQLQCVEQKMNDGEQALAKLQAATGESPALKQARANLAQAAAELSTVKAEQKALDYAIADISAKMAAANESLYSGRIKNPKELQGLQHELTSFQSQRDPLEENDLTLMEKAEVAEAVVGKRRVELIEEETRWHAEQRALAADIKAAEDALKALREKRGNVLITIPASDLATYNHTKKTHGWGIAKVEQGTCGRCRLTLSTAEVQRARAGQIVNCSSCGRLLFFD